MVKAMGNAGCEGIFFAFLELAVLDLCFLLCAKNFRDMVNGHNVTLSLNFLYLHSLSAHSENLLAHSGVSVYE